MQQPFSEIVGLLAHEGWEIRPLDIEKGSVEIVLPEVHYDLGMAIVTIKPPRFTCVARSSSTIARDFEERLIGDMVLENGKDILKVENRLGGVTYISGAGSARCRFGRKRDEVALQADMTVGLGVPAVFGLRSIMEYFVRNYANKAMQDCTRALAKGADRLHARVVRDG